MLCHLRQMSFYAFIQMITNTHAPTKQTNWRKQKTNWLCQSCILRCKWHTRWLRWPQLKAAATDWMAQLPWCNHGNLESGIQHLDRPATAAAAATRKPGCITLSTLTLMCSSSYLSTCSESFCKIEELFNGKMGDGWGEAGGAETWWEEWEVN